MSRAPSRSHFWSTSHPIVRALYACLGCPFCPAVFSTPRSYRCCHDMTFVASALNGGTCPRRHALDTHTRASAHTHTSWQRPTRCCVKRKTAIRPQNELRHHRRVLVQPRAKVKVVQQLGNEDLFLHLRPAPHAITPPGGGGKASGGGRAQTGVSYKQACSIRAHRSARAGGGTWANFCPMQLRDPAENGR